jgi:hypothetical protein
MPPLVQQAHAGVVDDLDGVPPAVIIESLDESKKAVLEKFEFIRSESTRSIVDFKAIDPRSPFGLRRFRGFTTGRVVVGCRIGMVHERGHGYSVYSIGPSALGTKPAPHKWPNQVDPLDSAAARMPSTPDSRSLSADHRPMDACT